MANEEKSEMLRLQIESAIIELKRKASSLGLGDLSKEDKQSFIEKSIEDGNTDTAMAILEQKMMETIKSNLDKVIEDEER